MILFKISQNQILFSLFEKHAINNILHEKSPSNSVFIVFNLIIKKCNMYSHTHRWFNIDSRIPQRRLLRKGVANFSVRIKTMSVTILIILWYYRNPCSIVFSFVSHFEEKRHISGKTGCAFLILTRFQFSFGKNNCVISKPMPSQVKIHM